MLAVLLGVLMIFSGIFHLIRVFDPEESHRVWLGIAGLLFIVIGVILIRHLNLTLAIIGLVIGITWIVQGLAALIGGISGGAREGRAWWIIFGVVSLIAGIVVVSTPTSSLNVLAVLLGIWFIIMGIFEIIGGFIVRHELRAQWPCVKPCRKPTACRNCYVMGRDRFGWVPNARPLSSAPRRRPRPEPRQQRLPARHELGLSPVRG